MSGRAPRTYKEAAAAPRSPAAPSAADVARLVEAVRHAEKFAVRSANGRGAFVAWSSWNQMYAALAPFDPPQAGAPSPMSAPEAAENAAAREEFGRQMDAAVASIDPLAAIEAWRRRVQGGPDWANVDALLTELRSLRADLADLVAQRRRVAGAAQAVCALPDPGSVSPLMNALVALAAALAGAP